MKKVTLKDIANELNVTVGTVSHVLNGIDDISEETKEKVLETARKMGYISNGPAASLRSGKTHTVAVIVPDISNPHIAYQIKLIEDKMREKGYSVIILNTNEDENIEYNAITTACSKQVDGILLCPCQYSAENIDFLKRIEVPFVLIGRFYEEIECDYVCSDDVKGGYLAGKFLLEKNCRNPLYIGAYKYIQGSMNRFEGLKKAFLDEGIELSEERFVEISPKSETVEKIIDSLPWESRDFDSIVAFSDIIAFELISQVNDRNIPVVGFDAINSHLFMPFHSVSVGMTQGGWATKAAEIILKKIKGIKKTYNELIDVEIYEFN